jgi:hypothetical protein
MAWAAFVDHLSVCTSEAPLGERGPTRQSPPIAAVGSKVGSWGKKLFNRFQLDADLIDLIG